MLPEKKKLLLHVCCAPCATSVLESLTNDFSITAFFYNPNIQPYAEYQKRLEQVEMLCRSRHIRLVVPDYDEGCWKRQTADFTQEPEGGARCAICFELRIARSAAAARSQGISTVATTLSVSPHKNARIINEIGVRTCGASPGIEFLERDFKKNDGYRKSCELSRRYGLYRQKYCGCLPSLAPSNGPHGSTTR